MKRNRVIRININIYIIGYIVAGLWFLAATLVLMTAGHVTQNVKYMTLVGIGSLLSTLTQKMVTEYHNYKRKRKMMIDTYGKDEYERYMKSKK